MITSLRDQLQSRCPSLTESEWDLLVKRGMVNEVETGAGDLDYLAAWVQDIRSAAGARAPGEPSAALLAPAALARRAATRAEALSALLAADAGRDNAVSGFRRAVLRGKLVKPDRVAAWVQRRAEPPSRLITSPEAMPDQVVRIEVPTLAFALPESSAVQHVPVAVESTLDQLRCIGESLARRYSWQPAQAATFILTDLVPLLEPVRARFESKYPIRAASRIVLDVDPTVTPKEVAARYARERGAVLTGRSRRISPKHLQLAIFADEHRDGTWEARMRQWNALHPDESYSHPSNFQRDATRAIKRIVDPPLGA